MNIYIPNLPQGAAQKLPGLLYMEYKVSELAEELGVSTKTIYKRYLPAGLPHRKDHSGNIWIVGTEFSEWITSLLKQKPARRKMAADEGYCPRCRQPRKFISMTLDHILSSGRGYFIGNCAECNCKMFVVRRVS